jgi:uncharacterized protein
MLETLVRQFLYHPVVNDEHATPPRWAGDCEEVWMDADDGNRIHGLYWPAADSRPTILFLHGNAQSVFEWSLVREDLAQLDAGLLLIDYPGYGKSSGHPREGSLYRAGDAALELLHERGVAETSIIVFGKSLGGGVASQISTDRNFAGVVLESTFRSIPSVAKQLLPMVPIDSLMRDERYDTINRITEIEAPLLIIHGTRDELIPVIEGEAIYAKATEPKELYLVEGAGHNDVSHVAGKAYGARIRKWMDCE